MCGCCWEGSCSALLAFNRHREITSACFQHEATRLRLSALMHRFKSKEHPPYSLSLKAFAESERDRDSQINKRPQRQTEPTVTLPFIYPPTIYIDHSFIIFFFTVVFPILSSLKILNVLQYRRGLNTNMMMS